MTSSILLAPLPLLAMDYNEAPELAAAVAAGTLPPVSERLPDRPEVFAPFDGIGKYGDKLLFGISG